MRRVVFNQKGGVGKTSICCNLAAAFATMGRKTLLIDLDAQGNATQYVTSAATAFAKTAADFFESTVSLNPFGVRLIECVVPTRVPGLDLIPASPALSDLQPKLEARYKIMKLRDGLLDVIEKGGYDEVIIDTPPALSVYTVSALIACERVIVPFDCDSFSAEAVQRVKGSVDEIREDHKHDLSIEAVIVNQFVATSKVSAEAVQGIRKQGFPVLEPFLSSGVAMKESHRERVPLVTLRPSHRISKDFLALANQMLGRQSSLSRAQKTTRSKISGVESTIS